MAPANGEDDFEVSQRRHIPIFNPIDDQAVFTEKAGLFPAYSFAILTKKSETP